MKLNNENESIQDQEWLDMPEFTQGKKEPYAKIIIRVDSKDHLELLAKQLNQPLTRKTKSAWFPFKSHFRGEKQPTWKSDES